MKYVLCALKEPNEHLLQIFYDFAKKHKWQIESCGVAIPENWDGDGVLTDYLKLPDLRKIHNFDQTPVVSRLLPPTGNIRTVLPDTLKIARMMVEYLASKGFTRFATVAERLYPGEINGRPIDVLNAVQQVLEERNFDMKCFLWTDLEKDVALFDFHRRWLAIRQFFAKQEKPFALILSTPDHLPLCYRVLDDMQLRVPEEVAVLTNTDNWLVTENAIVPTSYIGGEFQELGSKMVELLQEMMSGQFPAAETIYVTPSSIVSRHSTDTLAVSDLRLAKAVSFFLQNYMNLISVEDAAKVAGVSRGMLIRLFQQEFSKSPRRFFTGYPI